MTLQILKRLDLLIILHIGCITLTPFLTYCELKFSRRCVLTHFHHLTKCRYQKIPNVPSV
jgi:hypothetical protein